MEPQPQYQVRKSLPRALMPKIASLLVLAGIFYLGVLLNLSLLELPGDIKEMITLSALVFLGAIIILGLILAIRRARQPYLFYPDGILIHGQKVLYQSITNTTPQQAFLDKIFKTYRISLNQETTIKHLPFSIPLQPYLQQLITYSHQASSGSSSR